MTLSQALTLAAEHIALWRQPVIVLLAVLAYACIRFALESWDG
jgi:hypothetical protein